MRDLLERNLIPVRWYDVDTDDESAAMLDWLQIPREETPILVRNTSVLRNPSAAQVARELGLRAGIDGERFDLVVLGGGPAGLAAAVYGGSEGLRTLVAEAWAPGGQAGTSTRIENYLGFPTGVSGTELTHLLETVWPGVFAAGDVRAGATKRVAGAVGDGALAVRFAHQVLQA